MRRYSLEPRTRKYVKRYGYLSFARKYKKTIIGYRSKSNDYNIEKQEPAEDINIPPEKKDEILNKLL